MIISNNKLYLPIPCDLKYDLVKQMAFEEAIKYNETVAKKKYNSNLNPIIQYLDDKNLDMVKWIYLNFENLLQRKLIYPFAIRYKNIELIVWFHENFIDYNIYTIILFAIQFGDLDTIKYLYDNVVYNWNEMIMYNIICKGHLNIFKFLYYNTSIIYTKFNIDSIAPFNNHTKDVIIWLNAQDPYL